MADVKWIKLSIGLPDNRQLKQIRRLPGGDTIVLLWVYLMCLAGEVNDAGMIYFTPSIPYTEEMLADQFNMDVNTVRLGLETFKQFGMIEVVNNILCLPTWEKWQAEDEMSKIREQTKKRVAKHREKQRLLAGNVTCNVTVTQGNAIEEDKDIDIDIEEERDIDTLTVPKDTVCRTDVQRIINAWNDLGVSTVSKLTPNTKRYNNLRSRIRDYGTDSVLKAIDNIRQSDFLMGRKGDGWRITFDWFVLPNNFPKVLDGNYNNKEGAMSSGASSTNDTKRLGESIGTWL